MKQKSKPYAVRSDVHGRAELARSQLERVRAGEYAGLFDLGDLEVTHLDRDHPLRVGDDGSTLDTIIRNARRNGGLTTVAEETLEEAYDSLQRMDTHVRDVAESEIFYRGIAGNSEEVWTRIFDAIGSPEQIQRFGRLSGVFADARSDANVEFFVDGVPYNIGDNRPNSAVFYLPWKASMDSVNGALRDLDRHDVGKIVVLSHDYLTKGSLPEELRESMKPMRNEGQVVRVLDALSERDAEVVGLYGHIGLEHGLYEQDFVHRVKNVKAYHMDEREGGLFELDL